MLVYLELVLPFLLFLMVALMHQFGVQTVPGLLGLRRFAFLLEPLGFEGLPGPSYVTFPGRGFALVGVVKIQLRQDLPYRAEVAGLVVVVVLLVLQLLVRP